MYKRQVHAVGFFIIIKVGREKRVVPEIPFLFLMKIVVLYKGFNAKMCIRDSFNALTNIDESRLNDVSRVVESYSGIVIPANKPIVGENVFCLLYTSRCV